jgi:hypothetical protein
MGMKPVAECFSYRNTFFLQPTGNCSKIKEEEGMVDIFLERKWRK